VLTSSEVDFTLLAFQEHHLDKQHWHIERKHLPPSLRAVGSPALPTAKGGTTGGVGFLFSPTLPVTMPGHLFNTHQTYSVELYGIIFVSLYAPQRKADTLDLVSGTLTTLASQPKPYVVIGDFNYDVHSLRTEMHAKGHSHITFVDYGPTCHTSKGDSHIDAAILSDHAALVATRFSVQKTTLATHDVLHLYMNLDDSDAQYTYEAWDRPKAPQGSLQRPLWQAEIEGSAWDHMYHSVLSSPRPSQAQVDQLHATWLEWARKELIANLGTDVPNSTGDAFALRTSIPLQ
jgi:hypothetical protein